MMLGDKSGFEFPKITNSQHVIRPFFQINDGNIPCAFLYEKVRSGK